MRNQVFRKVSLDRLSSPEQLDSLMKVTTSRGWLALLSIVILLVAVIMWGLFGNIDTKINGQGILISSGGFRNIQSTSSGELTDISVEANDQVKQGEIIARISQPNLLSQLEQAQFTLKSYESLLKLNPLIQQKIVLQKQLVKHLQTQYLTASEVISPFTGKVVSVMANIGSMIGAGTPIFSIELTGKTVQALQAILYISAAQAQKVLPGMKVDIMPTSINKQDYGFMLGNVVSVARFPATNQIMLQTLGNASLVQQFSSNLVPLEVKVNLISNSQTYSGFQWSTPTGPPVKMNSGTLFGGSIIISSEHPITSIIPQIK